MHEGRVRGHDNGRERREVSSLRGRGNLFHGVRWLIVGEYLVDAQDDISEEQRALDGVAASTANTPSTQDNGAGDRHTD